MMKMCRIWSREICIMELLIHLLAREQPKASVPYSPRHLKTE